MNRSFLFLVFILTSCHSSLFKAYKLGQLKNKKLNEISGIAASHSNPGLIWAHNDSGSKPEVYLLNKQLEVKMVCRLRGAISKDWEDMAIGPGPKPDKSYLYIGDIGDNGERRSHKTIYRFEEPVLKSVQTLTDTITIDRFDLIHFKLENGSKDTEAMLLDPASKKIFLLSKKEKPASLYELIIKDYPDTLIAKRIGTLPIKRIVSADLSANGNGLLVKNYGHVYYWNNDKHQSIELLVKQKPVKLKYKIEPQGEAIGWDNEERGFYTLSERPLGLNSFLYYYERK
jgi:hypothetical protein